LNKLTTNIPSRWRIASIASEDALILPYRANPSGCGFWERHGVAALAFRLLPPLSPALQTRRLLALTLRDPRRLTTTAIPQSSNDWKGRVYSRLSALPEQAEPLQRAQLLAALSVGTEIIRLRRIARRFDLDVELDAALDALARGDSSVATERLGRLDRILAALPSTRPGVRVRLRAWPPQGA
jgi:Fusaric acid resistance protein family